MNQQLTHPVQTQEEAGSLTINYGKDPQIISGYQIYDHDYCEIIHLKWEPEKIVLLRSTDFKREKNGTITPAPKNQNVFALNANALDFLLDDKELIPPIFENMNIFFLNTALSRGTNGNLVRVYRYMYLDEKTFQWESDVWPAAGPWTDNDKFVCMKL